jgi:hypothetical protein
MVGGTKKLSIFGHLTLFSIGADLRPFWPKTLLLLRTPTTSNSNFVWARGKVLFKIGMRFPVFFDEQPGAEGQGAKKEVCFGHWILLFHFSFAHGSIWCHLQCGYYNLNVQFLIFFKKYYKVCSVEVWVKTLINKKKFSSLIITNMELIFEPCVFNLIWKWGAKDPQKKKRPSNFH